MFFPNRERDWDTARQIFFLTLTLFMPIWFPCLFRHFLFTVKPEYEATNIRWCFLLPIGFNHEWFLYNNIVMHVLAWHIKNNLSTLFNMFRYPVLIFCHIIKCLIKISLFRIIPYIVHAYMPHLSLIKQWPQVKSINLMTIQCIVVHLWVVIVRTYPTLFFQLDSIVVYWWQFKCHICSCTQATTGYAFHLY